MPGTYEFKFKTQTTDNISAWVKCSNPNSTIPTFKKLIFMKVDRLSWEAIRRPQAPQLDEVEGVPMSPSVKLTSQPLTSQPVQRGQPVRKAQTQDHQNKPKARPQ